MRAQAREAKQIGEGLGDGALVVIHRLSQTLDFKVIDEKKKRQTSSPYPKSGQG